MQGDQRVTEMTLPLSELVAETVILLSESTTITYPVEYELEQSVISACSMSGSTGSTGK